MNGSTRRAAGPIGVSLAGLGRRGAGLTGAGAVSLALGLGLAGALFDVLTGPGLGAVFVVCFVGGCVAATFLVRRGDLVVPVVMPPLVYVVIALIAGAAQGGGSGSSFLVGQALDLFTALVLEAPALMLATLASLLVALWRGLGRRAPVGRSRTHV